MKCGKEQKGRDKDTSECECGSRNFIFGSNFTYEKGEPVCGCGSKDFEFRAHFNMSPIHTKNYQCAKCGNTIGTQIYYKSMCY